jgi:type I restriction enzyme S subunit
LVLKKETANGSYLWQTINHKGIQARIQNLSGGSAGSMPNVSKERLKTLTLPLPPSLCPTTIRRLGREGGGARAKQRESERELENLFQSLMQEAFRGELVE